MRLRVFALLLAAPFAVQAQSDNMRLVGRLDPRSLLGYADVWGYVGTNGREYALLNTRQDGGLTVIDVTAEPPVEIAYFPGTGGSGSDVEVYGDYAYASSDTRPTQIFDLSDPTSPAFVGTFAADAHTITVAGDYLYTQGGPSPSGVLIYSLADPENPAFVGEYQPGGYIHDIHVRNDTMYAALIYGAGVDIVDVSDKANPQLINRFNYPGSGAHNVCSDPSGSYVYVGDEIGTGRWTRIFDVRDPLDVEQVGEIILDPEKTVHNCHVKDNLLYIGYYGGRGARVYDISDPAAPVEVAYYEIGGGLNGLMWSVYPFLPSGKLLGSLYFSGGLCVFRLDSVVAAEPGPEAPAGLGFLPPSPNPARDETTLRFSLDQAAPAARLTVYDAVGRPVTVLHDGPLAAGPHAVRLNTAGLPSGLYLTRLDAAGRTATRRLSVVH